MQKLNRKTKELVEATLIIGVARGEGANSSSHDGKKEKIEGSIGNLTHRQIAITKDTCMDFIEWLSNGNWICSSNDLWYQNSDGKPEDGLNRSELFGLFEKQYTEPCNGNCGMNYCDDNGCLENKPKSEGTDVATVL